MGEPDVVDTLGASPAGGAEVALITQSQWGAMRVLFERGRNELELCSNRYPEGTPWNVTLECSTPLFN